MGSSYYDNVYAVEEAALGAFLVILVVYLLLLVLGVASYVMTSLALHRIAKRRGIQDPWMAWLPFACDWLIGSIADEYDGRNGIKRKWRVLLLTWSIITAVGFVVFEIALFVILIISINSPAPDVAGTLGMFLSVYSGLILFAMITTAQGFCKAVCIYKVFESTVPKRSVTYFILYLLVPLAGPICLLACSKKGYPFPEEFAPVQEADALEVPAEVVVEDDAEVEVVAEETVAEVTAEESIFEDEE